MPCEICGYAVAETKNRKENQEPEIVVEQSTIDLCLDCQSTYWD